MTVTARTYDRLRPDGKTLTSDAKIVIIELWFMLYSRASPYEVRFSVKHPKLGNVVYQWSLPPTVVCHLYFLATRGSGAGLSERSCSALALSLADNFQKQRKQECYCPRPPGVVKRPQHSLAFSIESRFSMALLNGRAGRLTALFGGFRPGQVGRATIVGGGASHGA